MNESNDSVIDLAAFFRGAWQQIVTWAIAGAAAGLAYGLLAPKWYTAEVSVVPATQSRGGALGGTAAVLGMADLPFDLGGSADVDRLAAILRSTSVTDAVIAKFNLRARYRQDYLEDTRKALWNHCATKIDKKPNIVILTCEDKVPGTALAMTAYFADVANQVARRVSTSSAGEERRFLETRVEQARIDLDRASVKLREFQEKNKIVSLPEQAKAIVSSMATLRAEMLDKQMQLAYIDGFSSSDEATSDALRRQVGILQSKLKSLEASRESASSSAGATTQSSKRQSGDLRDPNSLFPPAMNVPMLQYQVEQLMREQKVQETLFTMLVQRYETARVSEARDTSSFQVLDRPVLPTKKSRPKRLTSIAAGMGAGSFLGLLVLIWRRRRQATNQVSKPEAGTSET